MKNKYGIKISDIKVGAVVWFKSDLEQTAEVIEVKRARWGGGLEVTVENNHGFAGEYTLPGQTTLVLSVDEIFGIQS